MQEKIKEIQKEIESFLAKNTDELEAFRIKYLSKKGRLTELFEEFKNVIPEERKKVGMLLNDLKNAAQNKINDLKKEFEVTPDSTKSNIDLTLPANFI